jgi:mono/diheme cytochrome c family protein
MKTLALRWMLPAILLLLALVVAPRAVAQSEGEVLFNANCASCHNLDRKLTGPALRGVVDRWDGELGEISAFIKNSQAYMKAGRPKSAYATNLYNEYNKTLMPAQALNDQQITAILTYIQEAPAPVAAAPAAPGDGVGASIPDATIYSSFALLVGILLLACVFIIFAIAVVAHAIRARDKGIPLNWDGFRSSIRAFFTNRFVATVVVLLLVVGGANAAYDFVWSVGLHQGYTPVQPIAYSHKLHAGELQIDCKYCHVGVEKGKSATFPSANICMNCHNLVEEGPKYGKAEIAKIREAYEKGKPIEWVRIHNLPDFVYFSHAQHVKVAGLECQECHGPVEEMEDMYQYSRLSMGWCVNCHRQKEVDLNKSEYYQTTYKQLHADMASGKLDKVTVEKLGGLECARCHY